jgi:hypothetical protein
VRRDEFVSVETEVSAAEQAAAQGQYHAAAGHLRRLLTQTRAVDYEYDEWCQRLAEVYTKLGRRRDAGWLQLYLHYFELARASFADSPGERGRCLLLEKRYNEAAQELLAAGLRVQAAVAYEEGKQDAKAIGIWEELLADERLRDRPYERALVHTNLGLATLRLGGDRAAGVRHLVFAQRLIEQVADEFETVGERERAFDCYQVLLKLGLDAGSFENLSEGYLNCIRILKEDGLKTYVLQYYEDFLQHALEREEHHAAATLYREVADYALRAGLPYHRHYLRRSAETWWREAQKLLERGGPIDLVENAYLASVEALSLVGDFPSVCETYAKLAGLDVGERKRARYQAIAARFRGAPAAEPEGIRFPEYLRQTRAYGDIWYVDLIEWELDGDPEQVGATIVGDLRHSNVTRRRALNLVLDVSDARARRQEGTPIALVSIAEGLGELQSYAALRPLEKLYEHADASVRRAATAALRKLYFKRSFTLIGRALHDRDPNVQLAAVEAIKGLHFTHAFHPLARIFREHAEDRVRMAALESIGRIGTLEAAELLIGVIRNEAGGLREVARRALSVFDNADILPVIEQHAEYEADPQVKRLLGELLARRRQPGAGLFR